jgi:hypothetical protein
MLVLAAELIDPIEMELGSWFSCAFRTRYRKRFSRRTPGIQDALWGRIMDKERKVAVTEFEQLNERLKAMPRRQYVELIRNVEVERRKEVLQAEQNHPARSGMTKDAFVQWIVRHHFAVDRGITKILYLPAGAPEKEVRLLEVNELAMIPENETVDAFNFMPDLEGVDYTLFVADVTPKQFEAIMHGKSLLPRGWQLKGNQEFELGER